MTKIPIKKETVMVEIRVTDISEDVYQSLLSNLVLWLYYTKRLAEPNYIFEFDMYEKDEE